MHRNIRPSSLLAALALALPAGAAHADTYYFSIKGNIVHADLATTTSRTDASGLVHDITVRLKVGQALSIIEGLVGSLRSPGEKGEALSLRVIRRTSETTAEVRSFSGVLLKDLDFSGPDATDKIGQPTVVLHMESRSMTVSQETPPTIAAKGAKLLENSFAAELPGLPTDQFAKIGAYRILPCVARICDSIDRFEITVSQPLGVWREWYQKASQDPAFRTTAKFSIVSPAFLKPVMTVSLTGVRPLSYTEIVGAATIDRAIITMSAESVTIDVH